MNKLKETFSEHWEKLILAFVALFCFYSLSISFMGIFGATNEEKNINELNKDIVSLLQKGKPPEIDTKEKAVEEFKKAFEKLDGFDAYQKVLPVKLFSEEAKDDPYKFVKDIVIGHTSAGSGPGPNCEKLYCKVRGENICMVCGAKGEREYKFNAPKLTDISTLRSSMSEALESNPYIDRQKIRIVWEDDIETDRAIFKTRKGHVYRIEINEKNEKELIGMVDRQTYQKDLRNFINDKNNNVRPIMKGGEILELVGENVGGALFKAPVKSNIEPKKDKNEGKATDLFNPVEEKKTEPADAPPVNIPVAENKVNKLQDEKVFFNFEDTSFEPLKKYRYVLLEIFSGESNSKKQLNEWKFSKPVDITTGAENVFYLSKVTKDVDAGGNPTLKDGKQVYSATFLIYQYIRVQNLFYKKTFPDLIAGDEVGSFIRKGENVDSVIKTAIKKNKTEPLKGNDATVTDAEWTKWKEKYPNSLKFRKDPIVIELSYFTGYKVLEVGLEDIEVMENDGPMVIDKDNPTDEKGNERKIQPKKLVKVKDKPFVLLENTLTKVQTKISSKSTKEIAEDLKLNKVKTIEDLKDDK